MKVKNGMVCPVCEIGKLSVIQKDIHYTYKGIDSCFNKPVFVCSKCAEEYLDPADQKQIDKELTISRGLIDMGMLKCQ